MNYFQLLPNDILKQVLILLSPRDLFFYVDNFDTNLEDKLDNQFWKNQRQLIIQFMDNQFWNKKLELDYRCYPIIDEDNLNLVYFYNLYQNLCIENRDLIGGIRNISLCKYNDGKSLFEIGEQIKIIGIKIMENENLIEKLRDYNKRTRLEKYGFLPTYSLNWPKDPKYLDFWKKKRGFYYQSKNKHKELSDFDEYPGKFRKGILLDIRMILNFMIFQPIHENDVY